MPLDFALGDIGGYQCVDPTILKRPGLLTFALLMIVFRYTYKTGAIVANYEFNGRKTSFSAAGKLLTRN